MSESLCAIDLERIHQDAGSDSSMPGMCHDYFSHDINVHQEEADVIYELYLSEKVIMIHVPFSRFVDSFFLLLRPTLESILMILS